MQKLKSISFAKKRMNQRDLKRLLQQKLNKSISKIQIFEEGIDIHTQIEFEKLTKELVDREQKTTELSVLEKNLFNEGTNIKIKKEILIELSFSEDVKAYRLIEKFHNECENNLKKWSALALQKGRVHIEHSLSNEEKIYISSGLGGSENRLRYFFALSSNDNKNFTELHKNIIKNELNFTIKKYDGIIEDLIFQEYYVTVVCLIPLKHSLDKIFRSILEECNNLGNFLSDKVIATNTEKFDNKTIEDLIKDEPEAIKKFDDFANSSLTLGQDSIFSDDEFEEFGDEFFEDDDDEDDFDDEDYNDNFSDDDILPF